MNNLPLFKLCIFYLRYWHHPASIERASPRGAKEKILALPRYFLNANYRWAGGRVVEGARLESVFRRKSNEGSNPSLSAISFSHAYVRGIRLSLVLFPHRSDGARHLARRPVGRLKGNKQSGSKFRTLAMPCLLLSLSQNFIQNFCQSYPCFFHLHF